MSSSPDDAIIVRPRRFIAEIARDKAAIRGAQALRYHVFANEMGATLHTLTAGLDHDEIDDYCDHLVVRDATSNRIIACTRLLRDDQAAKLGYFYSQTEFGLEKVLALPGRLLEIGRTCVDFRYRGSAVLTTLWRAAWLNMCIRVISHS